MLTHGQLIAEAHKMANLHNEREGKLHLKDGIECPLCKNKAWMKKAIVTDTDAYTVMYKCPNCYEKREKVKNAQDSGLGGDYGLKFDQYQVMTVWQRIAKEKAIAYAKDPTGWLIFCGQVGSGKTMLSSCVANQLLRQGRRVKMKSWPEVVRYTSVDYYKEKEALKPLQEVDVLFLDDLFKGIPTDREIAMAYEVINYRYANKKPTIITSEKTPAEIMDIDEAICSRMYEMCPGIIVIDREKGRDYRLQKATKKEY